MNRLATLEPDFAAQVAELLKIVQGLTGRTWALSDGRRTLEQQAALYAQGRTAPGKVVTMAPPGSSAHNFGLAADVWPITPTGAFDWGASDKLFRVLADQARQLGLVPGYYFKSIHDAPHIESKDWRAAQAKWRAGELDVA